MKARDGGCETFDGQTRKQGRGDAEAGGERMQERGRVDAEAGESECKNEGGRSGALGKSGWRAPPVWCAHSGKGSAFYGKLTSGGGEILYIFTTFANEMATFRLQKDAAGAGKSVGRHSGAAPQKMPAGIGKTAENCSRPHGHAPTAATETIHGEEAGHRPPPRRMLAAGGMDADER